MQIMNSSSECVYIYIYVVDDFGNVLGTNVRAYAYMYMHISILKLSWEGGSQKGRCIRLGHAFKTLIAGHVWLRALEI